MAEGSASPVESRCRWSRDCSPGVDPVCGKHRGAVRESAGASALPFRKVKRDGCGGCPEPELLLEYAGGSRRTRAGRCTLQERGKRKGNLQVRYAPLRADQPYARGRNLLDRSDDRKVSAA